MEGDEHGLHRNIDNSFPSSAESNSSPQEAVVRLPLTELHPFKGYPALQGIMPRNQPYLVRDDDPTGRPGTRCGSCCLSRPMWTRSWAGAHTGASMKKSTASGERAVLFQRLKDAQPHRTRCVSGGLGVLPQ